jgi:hypothetical protein
MKKLLVALFLACVPWAASADPGMSCTRSCESMCMGWATGEQYWQCYGSCVHQCFQNCKKCHPNMVTTLQNQEQDGNPVLVAARMLPIKNKGAAERHVDAQRVADDVGTFLEPAAAKGKGGS